MPITGRKTIGKKLCPVCQIMIEVVKTEPNENTYMDSHFMIRDIECYNINRPFYNENCPFKGHDPSTVFFFEMFCISAIRDFNNA